MTRSTSQCGIDKKLKNILMLYCHKGSILPIAHNKRSLSLMNENHYISSTFQFYLEKSYRKMEQDLFPSTIRELKGNYAFKADIKKNIVNLRRLDLKNIKFMDFFL